MIIQCDFDGTIIINNMSLLLREKFEKEIKEDEELKRFVEENLLLRKIRDGEGLTSPELVELELQLSTLKPGLTIDNVQKYQNIDFISFLRKIIGLEEKYDPKELIEYEFDNFIGSYNVIGTESLDGISSQITDTVKIKTGMTSDLSISTQNFGTLDATVTGDESFVISKQDTKVKVDGESVQIEIQGTGTVVDDFLTLSGSYSVSGATVTFQLSGSKV